MSGESYTTMENPSWYLYGPGSAKLQDHGMPSLKNHHDVLIRIRYVGVCGSDVSNILTMQEMTSDSETDSERHRCISGDTVELV